MVHLLGSRYVEVLDIFFFFSNPPLSQKRQKTDKTDKTERLVCRVYFCLKLTCQVQ